MKKMLFMMDTQWCHVQGSDYLNVMRNQLKYLLTKEAQDLIIKHFGNFDEALLKSYVTQDYIDKLNNFVKNNRKNYNKIITSFNLFETDVERNEIIYYQDNTLEMLPKIKNQRMIESFVDPQYVDYIGYEYHQRTNQKLIDLMAENDIIDVCGLSVCGCVNEIVNMEYITQQVLKVPSKVYRFIKDYIVNWEHDYHLIKNVEQYNIKIITGNQIND